MSERIEQIVNQETLISTDILGAGALGGIKLLRELYPEDLRNLEAIGWRGTTDWLLQEADAKCVSVKCIHGQAGIDNGLRPPNIRWAKQQLSDLLIVPTDTLLEKYAPTRDVLVHTRVVKDEQTVQQFARAKGIGVVWIENDKAGIEGVNKTLDVIAQLKQVGVNAQLMFDICHFIGPDVLTSGNIKTMWDNALQFLDDYSRYPNHVFTGVHFPIGRLVYDSLPILTMSNDMLRDFAEIFARFGERRLVLENQQSSMQQLAGFFYAYEVYELKKRTDTIYDRLAATGIV